MGTLLSNGSGTLGDVASKITWPLLSEKRDGGSQPSCRLLIARAAVEVDEAKTSHSFLEKGQAGSDEFGEVGVVVNGEWLGEGIHAEGLCAETGSETVLEN